MTDDIEKIETGPPEPMTEARRTFLKRASQVAVTTPAVTLLLAAAGKSAQAAFTSPQDGKGSPGTLDGGALDGGDDKTIDKDGGGIDTD